MALICPKVTQELSLNIHFKQKKVACVATLSVYDSIITF